MEYYIYIPLLRLPEIFFELWYKKVSKKIISLLST